MLNPGLDFSNARSLTDRLSAIHDQMLENHPQVTRIACAIYEGATDTLKTFINSTRSGSAITGYTIRLSESTSLSALAKTGTPRVIQNIHNSIQSTNAHSEWLLSQGYQSSFTVPLIGTGGFIGFTFFDASVADAFTDVVQRDLLVYSNLINMAINSELSAFRAMVGSARMARDFANLRDFETGAHLERMSRISEIIALGIATECGISDEQIQHIRVFAPLHDIGKIGIPDYILLKQGKLTAEERDIMETHVTKGVAMIDRIVEDFNFEGMSSSATMRNIVACHHEYLDGSGYPARLKGDQIPIEARIVTVADIFDALTCLRPYKQAWSVENALHELQRMVTAGQLDSRCVNALAGNIASAQKIIDNYRDLEAQESTTS